MSGRRRFFSPHPSPNLTSQFWHCKKVPIRWILSKCASQLPSAQNPIFLLYYIEIFDKMWKIVHLALLWCRPSPHLLHSLINLHVSICPYEKMVCHSYAGLFWGTCQILRELQFSPTIPPLLTQPLQISQNKCSLFTISYFTDLNEAYNFKSTILAKTRVTF